MATVLVTGGTGFIASYCIQQLLDAGYSVRTSVRSLMSELEVRAMVTRAGATSTERLSFFEADLMHDGGWRAAMSGCDYVLHVASPFPAGAPAHENDLIVPARAGALRVLATARDTGVRRVVMTSSFAAIGYGQPARKEPFDERDWTDTSARVGAYVKSKTLAERAAWDFMKDEGGSLELSVINPTFVLGPALGPDYSASIAVIHRMLSGGMPACPRLYHGVVDVRDVADLHLRAMTRPEARGERFLATSGDFMSMLEIAAALRNGLGGAAARVPTRVVPDWLLRLVALRQPLVRQIASELGKVKSGSSAKARNLLGWRPRLRELAIVDSGRSLLRLGLVSGAS